MSSSSSMNLAMQNLPEPSPSPGVAPEREESPNHSPCSSTYSPRPLNGIRHSPRLLHSPTCVSNEKVPAPCAVTQSSVSSNCTTAEAPTLAKGGGGRERQYQPILDLEKDSDRWSSGSESLEAAGVTGEGHPLDDVEAAIAGGEGDGLDLGLARVGHVTDGGGVGAVEQTAAVDVEGEKAVVAGEVQEIDVARAGQ
uniref:Diphosphomevalonate decarboxylase n=1 Tax=Oryza punctata TaxID=4537 RepID=A0A0E0JUH8_ORYPU